MIRWVVINERLKFAEQKRCPHAASLHKQRRGSRVLNDFYFKEAKRCGYMSRAAFKLVQIDDQCNVIKRGSSVLDLGCFPGAWLQVACQRLGPTKAGGRIIGIDLKSTNIPDRFCDQRVTVRFTDLRLGN
jgi:23S rRNA U2552 (ribose-2'-O)-methylase RlmE/FtsJ